MGHIDTAYSAGDDALANESILTIDKLAGIFELAEETSLRVTVVDIPEASGGTYIVDYKTVKVEKPSGKIETPTEFTISFRADKYMLVYQAIQKWHQEIYNNNTGGIAADDPLNNKRTDISVKSYDSTFSAVPVPTYTGWQFKKAFPKSVGAVSFDQSNGEPIIVQVTFSFLQMLVNGAGGASF